MILQKRLLIFLILLSMAHPIFAKDQGGSLPSDSVRIERLAGLCRLWGVAKYFHPFITYKNIDWDDALVKTIPRVNKAVTAIDYRRAVEYMISFLHDPNTYAVDPDFQFTPAKISDVEDYQPYLIWTEDSIAVVVADRYGSFNYHPDKFIMMDDIMSRVLEARGVIIDLRRLDKPADPDEPDSYINESLFEIYLPRLLKKSMTLAGNRSISYSDGADLFPHSYGSFSRRFTYLSGFEVAAAFEGETSPKIVLVVNEGSDRFQRLMIGLQESHQASIVYEGSFWKELGVSTFSVSLPDGIEVKVRTDEVIRADGGSATHPDLVIPYVTDTTLLASPPVQLAVEIINGRREVPPALSDYLPTTTKSRMDSVYFDENLPSPEWRILAAAKFWNGLRYFYPYFDSDSSALNDMLPDFINRMEQANTKLQYTTTLANMLALLKDSNADIESKVMEKYFGKFRPHFEVMYIDGKTVINRVVDSPEKYIPELDPGDVILSIDDENIDTLRARLRELFSASTPQGLEVKINRYILNGEQNSIAHLSVLKSDGDTVQVKAERAVMYPWLPECRYSVEIFPNGYGYIDMDRCCLDLSMTPDKVIDSIRATPALIVDLRGFDRGCGPEFLRYLMKREVVASKIYEPIRNSPDPLVSSWNIWDDRLSPEDGEHYHGKIVVLIDGTTTLGGERYCLYLQNGADAILIGTPTDGTPGSKAYLNLPGDTRISYSQSDVRYPDGRAIHGVGIQPDIVAEPTIEGIAHNKDEILEAAIKFLNKNLKK